MVSDRTLDGRVFPQVLISILRADGAGLVLVPYAACMLWRVTAVIVEHSAALRAICNNGRRICAERLCIRPILALSLTFADLARVPKGNIV